MLLMVLPMLEYIFFNRLSMYQKVETLSIKAKKVLVYILNFLQNLQRLHFKTFFLLILIQKLQLCYSILQKYGDLNKSGVLNLYRYLRVKTF